MICNTCKKDVTRVLSPYISASGRKQYPKLDGNGKRWSGKVCPPCVALRYQVVIRKEPQPKPRKRECELTSRKCRGCGIALPVSKYFNCDYCHNLLPDCCEWNGVTL